MKKRLFGVLAVVAATVVIGLAAGPAYVDKDRNRIRQQPPYSHSPVHKKIHDQLLVADLHADTLLWDRPLDTKSTYGHVDLPRLREGNVALQAFTVVTSSPRTMNIHSTDPSGIDNITLLAMAQRWPVATYSSLFARAKHQAMRLHRLAKKRPQGFKILFGQRQLKTVVERAQAGEPVIGGLLGVEGAHCLEGKLENVEGLFRLGFRMVGLTHFFDNEVGGSAHGLKKGGLTEFGKKVLPELERLGMVIDLAHASEKLIEDVLQLTTKPVVVSHTGVKGTCDNPRNLSDSQLRAIAAQGGVIGIGYWKTAVCGTDAEAIAKAILHAVSVVGADHVALGSDFDGSVTTPFDASGLARITSALKGKRMSSTDLAKVMGGNVVRVLRQTLPESKKSSEELKALGL